MRSGEWGINGVGRSVETDPLQSLWRSNLLGAIFIERFIATPPSGDIAHRLKVLRNAEAEAIKTERRQE